jgi:HlyD family secretion protein
MRVKLLPRRLLRGHALLVLASLVALTGCDAKATPPGGPGGAGKGEAPAPREAHTAAAALAPWEQVIEVTGALLAREQATVAAEVAGRVLAVEVDVGSPVAAGQALVRIDPTDLELAVDRATAALVEARTRLGIPADAALDGADDQARSDEVPVVLVARALLDQATAEHTRVVALRQQGILSPADLDAAQAGLRAAESRLAEARDEVRTRWAVLAQRKVELRTARERLRRAEVAAPFQGAVLARLVAPGDYVVAGTPVATVVSVDPLRARAEIPERLAPRVRAGQTVRVWLEGAAAPLTATIARVSPALAAGGRVLAVEADLPNPEGAQRAGSFARFEVVVDPAASALVVPASAVRTFAGLDKLLVVEAGVAKERKVTLGRREAARVEVVEGLAAGEAVVLEPGALRTGTPIVAPAAAKE